MPHKVLVAQRSSIGLAMPVADIVTAAVQTCLSGDCRPVLCSWALHVRKRRLTCASRSTSRGFTWSSAQRRRRPSLAGEQLQFHAKLQAAYERQANAFQQQKRVVSYRKLSKRPVVFVTV